MPDEIATPHPRFGRDRWPERLAGRAVAAVDAHGKHLFLRFEGEPDDPLAPADDRRVGHVRAAALGRSPRRAWLALRRGDDEVVQFDGPVLELMTDSRTRLDQRIAALGPDIVAPDVRRGRVPAPAAPRRPDAADRRRAARPADDRRDRQPVEDRGLLRGRDRPVAAHRRGHRRGGAAHRPRDPPVDAGVGRARDAGRATGPSTARPGGRARAAARASARAARATTTARRTGARGASVRRIGHKGADLIAPGNTPASFDAALEAGVDMIEFDVLPEHRTAPASCFLAHDYERPASGAPRTLEEGLAHLASAARTRRRARRRPQAARLRGPRRSTRSASTACSSARWSRRWRRVAAPHPRARADAPARLVGPAAQARPVRSRKVTAAPRLRGAAGRARAAAAAARRAHPRGPLRRADGQLAPRHAARSCARCSRPAASSTCGRSTTRRRIERLERLGVTGVHHQRPAAVRSAADLAGRGGVARRVGAALERWPARSRPRRGAADAPPRRHWNSRRRAARTLVARARTGSSSRTGAPCAPSRPAASRSRRPATSCPVAVAVASTGRGSA